MQDWRQAIRTPTSYRVGNSTIRMQTHFVYSVAIVGISILILLYLLLPSSRTGLHMTNEDKELINDIDLGHEYHSRDSYNSTYPLSPIKSTKRGLVYDIGIISDLDTFSRSNTEKDMWLSFMKRGQLIYNPREHSVSVDWNPDFLTLKSPLSLGGRGMELSELIVFNGKLHTVDDRTGIVYEIDKGRVIPWVILSDGDGKQTKGFKSEWAAVKNKKLYVGGLGKEWVSSSGEVLNINPQWVKVITQHGEVYHVDWHENYDKIRKEFGIKPPGYMIHESAVWSQIHNSWFFLPRRLSHEKYDEKKDEQRGTNILVKCSENFQDVSFKTVGEIIPTHGFSSFKFIPGTNDEVIIALRSEEDGSKIASYIIAFDINGKIIMPETPVGPYKFEGIEFI